MLPDLPADDEMRISTRRLDLVPLTTGDADDLFPVLEDPALGRFTGETPPADVEAVRTGFAGWQARRSPDGAELWLNWIVRRHDDARAVGYVQATVGDGDAAIAWTVGTAFQRQGFATEAGHALIAWLRDTLGVPSIVGSIHPDNVASQTAARRIGLRPTDRRHEGEVVWEYVPPDERPRSDRIEGS
ncbi:MAG: GNAT family N-acetyltransferase [Actinomycetota bacterium]